MNLGLVAPLRGVRTGGMTADIAVYVHKILFHSVQKVIYGLHQRYTTGVACSNRQVREEEATNPKHK